MDNIDYCEEPEQSALGREFLRRIPAQDWDRRYEIWEYQNRHFGAEQMLEDYFPEAREKERDLEIICDERMEELKKFTAIPGTEPWLDSNSHHR